MLLTACASAPVQEMSDARMAIRAAEDAGAPSHSATELEGARQKLGQAQQLLESGDYRGARELAVYARNQAMLAREKADIQSAR